MINKVENEIMKNWDSHKPSVSISCITYNHENYICDALDGFLMQETDFPIEILIYDDASIDRTASIIKSYEQIFPNIIKPIYQSENQYSKGFKPSVMYNYPRAKGKYIALCEGDDYWKDPQKLYKQYYFMEKNENYILCYHYSKFMIKGITSQHTYPRMGKDFTSEELLSKVTIIPTATKFFKNIYNDETKNDFLNSIYDTMLNVYLGLFGKCKFIKDIEPSIYRIHEGGIWSNLNKKERFLSNLEVFIKICRLLNKKGHEKFVNERIKEIIIFLFTNMMSFNIKIPYLKLIIVYFKNKAKIFNIKKIIRKVKNKLILVRENK